MASKLPLKIDSTNGIVRNFESGDFTALSAGGTNADLSATGGTSQVLKQSSAGAAITVGTLSASDVNAIEGRGNGAATEIAYFTDANTIDSDSGFVYASGQAILNTSAAVTPFVLIRSSTTGAPTMLAIRNTSTATAGNGALIAVTALSTDTNAAITLGGIIIQSSTVATAAAFDAALTFRASYAGISNANSNVYQINQNTGVHLWRLANVDLLNLTSTGLKIGNGTASVAKLEVAQSTTTSPVAQFSTVTTGDDPTYKVNQARITTTDATVTTLFSFTSTTNTENWFSGFVIARRTGGSAGTANDGGTYKIEGSFVDKAGTVTVSSTTTTIREDQAGWDVVLDNSGTTIRVRVTGATNNNVTWHLSKFETGQVNA